MGSLQDTDWKLIQFKYECLDFSLEQLSEENNVSLAVLKYASEKWEKAELPSPKSMSLEDLNENTDERSQLINVLTRRLVEPKLAALGGSLIDKTARMANSLNLSDPRVASTLKALTQVYLQLKEALIPVSADQTEDGSTPTKWEVQIVEPKTNGPREAETVSGEKEKV